MDDQPESIIDFAFRQALNLKNINIIKQCLAAGISIKNISSCWMEPDQANVMIIFKMLLDYDSDALFENTVFMSSCITSYTDYYLKALVTAGYDCNYSNAQRVMEECVIGDLPDNNLFVLLDNGFDKYSKQAVMACINYNKFDTFRELVYSGKFMYELLDDMCNLITTMMQSEVFICPKMIKFILDNIYHIELLGPVISKYMLLSAKNILPLEINIVIMQLYMELDYVKTDKVRNMLILYKPNFNVKRHRMI